MFLTTASSFGSNVSRLSILPSGRMTTAKAVNDLSIVLCSINLASSPAPGANDEPLSTISAWGIWVGIPVGDGVAVEVSSTRTVAVDVGDRVGVLVGVGIGGVGVCVGIPVGVDVGDIVGISVGVSVGVSVTVGVAVGVDVGDIVGISVGVSVGVSVAIGVAVGVSVGVAVGGSGQISSVSKNGEVSPGDGEEDPRDMGKLANMVSEVEGEGTVTSGLTL